MADEFVVRRPRHEVLEGSGCEVTVQWIASEAPLIADLGDVSRHGLRLVLDAEIPGESRLRVRLKQPTNAFELVLTMTVRWACLQDDGRWTAGCEFDQQLSWETMGEMFLNGILSAEELPSDHLPVWKYYALS